MKVFIITSIAILLLTGCNSKKEITIGTFNIAWLGDGIEDKNPRTDLDYDNIASVINSLQPDVMACQEIENLAALNQIIDTNNYKVIISTYPQFQKTALIIDKKIAIKEMIQVDEITLGNKDLRPGIIAFCQFGDFNFLVGSFHFKSTSRYDNTPVKKARSYEIRREQSEILIKKLKEISEKFDENDIILLGDFNDNPTKSNSNIIQLENNDYDFITSDLNSCKFSIWKGIDHIILSKSLVDNLIPNSIFVEDIYSMYGEEQVKHISDHCPVIARISLK